MDAACLTLTPPVTELNYFPSSHKVQLQRPIYRVRTLERQSRNGIHIYVYSDSVAERVCCLAMLISVHDHVPLSDQSICRPRGFINAQIVQYLHSILCLDRYARPYRNCSINAREFAGQLPALAPSINAAIDDKIYHDNQI